MITFCVISTRLMAPSSLGSIETPMRNGYRERVWETRAGADGAAHPQATQGQLLPRLPGAAAAAEKALAAVVQEAYVHGVSTRSVDDLIKAMGTTGISKSQVSRLCEEIDERVKAF